MPLQSPYRSLSQAANPYHDQPAQTYTPYEQGGFTGLSLPAAPGSDTSVSPNPLGKQKRPWAPPASTAPTQPQTSQPPPQEAPQQAASSPITATGGLAAPAPAAPPPAPAAAPPVTFQFGQQASARPEAQAQGVQTGGIDPFPTKAPPVYAADSVEGQLIAAGITWPGMIPGSTVAAAPGTTPAVGTVTGSTGAGAGTAAAGTTGANTAGATTVGLPAGQFPGWNGGPDLTALNDSQTQLILRILQSPESLSPQVVETMQNQQKQQALAQQQQSQEAMMQDLASRGFTDSGQRDANNMRLQDLTNQNILTGHQNIEVDAAKTNMQDRLNALAAASGVASGQMGTAVQGYGAGLAGSNALANFFLGQGNLALGQGNLGLNQSAQTFAQWLQQMNLGRGYAQDNLDLYKWLFPGGFPTS